VAVFIGAVELLGLPWLKLLGGSALLWIGVKLIAGDAHEEGADPNIVASDRLWAAVRTVVVADLVISIDNVLGVAAAAKGSVPLLVFGLLVSIPLVVAGSQIILRLVERFPILILAGGGLLGWIAGDMIVDDEALAAWIDSNAGWLEWSMPAAGVVLVIAVAKWMERRRAVAP